MNRRLALLVVLLVVAISAGSSFVARQIRSSADGPPVIDPVSILSYRDRLAHYQNLHHFTPCDIAKFPPYLDPAAQNGSQYFFVPNYNSTTKTFEYILDKSENRPYILTWAGDMNWNEMQAIPLGGFYTARTQASGTSGASPVGGSTITIPYDFDQITAQGELKEPDYNSGRFFRVVSSQAGGVSWTGRGITRSRTWQSLTYTADPRADHSIGSGYGHGWYLVYDDVTTVDLTVPKSIHNRLQRFGRPGETQTLPVEVILNNSQIASNLLPNPPTPVEVALWRADQKLWTTKADYSVAIPGSDRIPYLPKAGVEQLRLDPFAPELCQQPAPQDLEVEYLIPSVTQETIPDTAGVTAADGSVLTKVTPHVASWDNQGVANIRVAVSPAPTNPAATIALGTSPTATSVQTSLATATDGQGDAATFVRWVPPIDGAPIQITVTFTSATGVEHQEQVILVEPIDLKPPTVTATIVTAETPPATYTVTTNQTESVADGDTVTLDITVDNTHSVRSYQGQVVTRLPQDFELVDGQGATDHYGNLVWDKVILPANGTETRQLVARYTCDQQTAGIGGTPPPVGLTPPPVGLTPPPAAAITSTPLIGNTPINIGGTPISLVPSLLQKFGLIGQVQAAQPNQPDTLPTDAPVIEQVSCQDDKYKLEADFVYKQEPYRSEPVFLVNDELPSPKLACKLQPESTDFEPVEPSDTAGQIAVSALEGGAEEILLLLPNHQLDCTYTQANRGNRERIVQLELQSADWLKSPETDGGVRQADGSIRWKDVIVPPKGKVEKKLQFTWDSQREEDDQ